MPKRSLQQEERRLWDSGQVDINERERVIDQIAKNKELQSELINLRKHYRIAFKNISEQVQWVKSQPIETLAGFSNDIKAIKEKHCISERMSDEFWVAVWSFPKSGYKMTASLGSMPKIHWSKESGILLLITPETDIRNELVIEFIETWQKVMINNNDKPPQPQRIKDSRKLNWIPVWEWHMRHPHITRKELATILNRNCEYVRSKLEELDKQAGKSLPFSFQK